MRIARLLPLLGWALALAATPAHACGSESPCEVAGGEYYAAVPPGAPAGERLPALVFFHGWQATAESVVKDAELRGVADRLGIVLVAPQGVGRSWSYPGSPSHDRDEFAFLGALLDDAIRRFPVDPDRIVAGGFSIGGSMTWFAACYMGERFAAFIAVAGAYWNPVPRDCPSPLPMLVHIHGTADTVVPMAGRAIRERFRQSDIGESIDSWIEGRRCIRETRAEPIAGLACRRWAGCGEGAITLCLHDGGHLFRADWIEGAWRAIARLRGWDVPER